MKKVYDLKGKEIDVIQVVPSKNYIYLPLGYIGLIESDNPELKVIFFTTDFLEWANRRFKKKPPYSIRKDITWLKVKKKAFNKSGWFWEDIPYPFEENPQK